MTCPGTPWNPSCDQPSCYCIRHYNELITKHDDLVGELEDLREELTEAQQLAVKMHDKPDTFSGPDADTIEHFRKELSQ